MPVGEGKVIIDLPGPPFELEPMFVDQVEPYLQARSGHAPASKYIRIFGMGGKATWISGSTIWRSRRIPR